MVALSTRDKSRTRFHLGYGNGTPAGDRARLEAAMVDIQDNYWWKRIRDILNRCDRAFKECESDEQSSGLEYKELITGDINRAVVRFRAERLRVRRENYIDECDLLADTLFVPNYRNPNHYYARFYTEGSAFIRAVPGPADTAVGAEIYLAKLVG